MYPTDAPDSEKQPEEWIWMLQVTKSKEAWDAVVGRIIAVYGNLPAFWYDRVMPKNMYAKQVAKWVNPPK